MERALFGIILVLVTIPLVALVGTLLVNFLWLVGEEHPWAVVAVPVAIVVGAVGLAMRQRRKGAVSDTGRHPGITMHRIPVAGGVGLVFVLGYVFMFWHGAPSFRPLVIGLPVLGAVVAGIAIWLTERRRDSEQHRGDVAGEAGQPEDAPDEARKEDGR